MSEDDAIFRAILALPDDDAPRLIFADWLEEHGDLPRAEFIRTQIKLAQLPADDPDRSRLVQAERTLWRANRAAWTKWIPGWVKYTQFHRGFLERIQTSAVDYLAHGGEIRLQTPLLAARIDGPAAVAIPLFRSRALEGLRSLRLGLRIPRDAWEHLFSNPYLSELIELDLMSQGYPEELVPLLSASQSLPRLRDLRLAWMGLGDAITIQLVGQPWIRRLERLDLSRNGIGREGGEAILASPYLEQLSWISLKGNPVASIASLVRDLNGRFGTRLAM